MKTKEIEISAEIRNKSKGVLFKPDMIKAIIEGRKTQTRRVSFKYKKGDILYIKEAVFFDPPDPPIYKLDCGFGFEDCPFKSPLFMRKVHARFFLKVVNVWNEYLQDISEENAKKEGVEIVEYNYYQNYLIDKSNWIYQEMNKKSYLFLEDPKGSFASLWDSINGNKEDLKWSDNPLITVVEFELLGARE